METVTPAKVLKRRTALGCWVETVTDGRGITHVVLWTELEVVEEGKVWTR